MSATIQVRVDKELKAAADDLFIAMGMDTSTAIRMFLYASLQRNALPFKPRRILNAETIEAMEDVRLGRNLYGPYKTAEEMIAALESDDDA